MDWVGFRRSRRPTVCSTWPTDRLREPSLPFMRKPLHLTHTEQSGLVTPSKPHSRQEESSALNPEPVFLTTKLPGLLSFWLSPLICWDIITTSVWSRVKGRGLASNIPTRCDTLQVRESQRRGVASSPLASGHGHQTRNSLHAQSWGTNRPARCSRQGARGHVLCRSFPSQPTLALGPQEPLRVFPTPKIHSVSSAHTVGLCGLHMRPSHTSGKPDLSWARWVSWTGPQPCIQAVRLWLSPCFERPHPPMQVTRKRSDPTRPLGKPCTVLASLFTPRGHAPACVPSTCIPPGF